MKNTDTRLRKLYLIKLLQFFVVYVAVDATFGMFYYYISLHDPKALLTQNDVFHHFQENTFQSLKRELKNTEYKKAAYDAEIAKNGGIYNISIKCSSRPFIPRYDYQMIGTFRDYFTCSPSSISFLKTEIQGFHEEPVKELAKEKAIEEVRTIFAGLNAQIEFFKNKLNKFEENIDQEIANLTIIDCLYFSTISMTTTGFGDIVPGKSYVRVFVIFQSLISLLLIVVVLNQTIRNI